MRMFAAIVLADPETLNKLLNKSQRILDELARMAAASQFEPVKPNLDKITQAAGLVSGVQALLWQRVPELAFHFDPGKPDTAFMSKVRQLMVEAQALEAAGAQEQAALKLQEALELEPPASQHEAIEKELCRLKAQRSS
jgi:hypothetical protein